MTRPVAIILSLLLWIGPATGAPPLVVTAVGDVNLGTAYPPGDYLPADQGRALLAPVRHWLKGDVVFGNLEGPLADGGTTDKCGPGGGCYAFRTPTAYAPRLLEAGFTVMSLANNHALDFGAAGRSSTMQVLDRLGIAHSGPVGDVARLTVRDKSVALVAFTTAEHSYNLLDIPAARRLVQRLADQHDIVLVSFHGGKEGRSAAHVPFAMERLGNEPRGELRRFAHAVIEAGADLVLGHGPHVLRGLEVYRRRLIAYSLGNFCTYGRFNLSGPLGIAAVLRVELAADDGRFLGGRILPTRQAGRGGALPDRRRRAIALLRELSRQDFGPAAARIDDRGRVSPPAGDSAGVLSLLDRRRNQAIRRLLKWLRGQGFAQEQLLRWFGDARARLLPAVVKAFRHPAEKLSYQAYKKLFIKPELLQAAAKFLQDKGRLLAAVEKAYGVDAHLLAAIVATETRFGEKTGTIPAVNALTTVVTDYPRRSRWARRELAQLLKLYPENPLAVLGSYAGAVGLVQFMPSSIRAYGVDYDRDGRIDLSSWPDALASAANYLKRHGYRRQGPYRRGSAAYRAVFRYNPSHNYARLVGELAACFARPPATQKARASGTGAGRDPDLSK